MEDSTRNVTAKSQSNCQDKRKKNQTKTLWLFVKSLHKYFRSPSNFVTLPSPVFCKLFGIQFEPPEPLSVLPEVGQKRLTQRALTKNHVRPVLWPTPGSILQWVYCYYGLWRKRKPELKIVTSGISMSKCSPNKEEKNSVSQLLWQVSDFKGPVCKI